MRSLRFLVLSSLLACAAGAAWAAPHGSTVSDPNELPHRYFLRDLDGRLVRVTNPVDGRTWAVWAYRNRGEYDIAITSRDSSGRWTEPTFFGGDDSLSQVQPSLAVDANGNLYLAFAVRESGRIFLTMRPAGAAGWSAPALIPSDADRHWMPALRVVGTRLVLAYRSASGTDMLDLALLPPATMTPFGIQEGPDGFPPPGNKEGDEESTPDPIGRR